MLVVSTPSRSFIEKTKSFPTNIEVEVSQTYTSPPDMTPAAAAVAPQPPPNPFAQGMRAGTNATVVMHYSMVKLPEKPMMPRLFDERVGYFTIRKIDYGIDEQRAPERTYITRWRLEKKDPNAELSEPVKPIVYYVDPATPTKWVPWIKKGIEDWQPAFEAAGFKNAIIAKEAHQRLRIQIGTRKTRDIQSFAICLRRSRMPRVRTLAIRVPVKFSSQTFSTTTT